jgi:predicted AAA+ superfamily ATPase
MFQVMKDVSESLAGRVANVQLQGLSLAEIKGWKSDPFNPEITTLDRIQSDREAMTINDLFKQIFVGSFPYPLTKNVNRDAFFNSYVNTYIERDIRQLTQVADELSFYRFLTACAARTGTVVDYADIARDVEISAPTAKKWLSLLVSTGIVYLLDSYHSSALKRAIKAPKMYFMDTGLCAYLTKWDSPDSLEVGAMSGSIFESFVVGEIVKSYYNAGKRPPLSFYRDSNKVEIDLILEMNNTLYPNEIKKTGNPGRNAAKHLQTIEKAGKPVGMGNILCMVPEITPIDRSCFAVPVWII